MRLLLSIDNTDASREALTYAVDVANRLDADLLVTYVLEQSPEEATDRMTEDIDDADSIDADDPPPVVRDAVEDARATGKRLLREAANRARATGLDVETTVLTGDPSTAITAFAEAEGADGIVVGHRSAAGEEELIDSVARDLIDRASVPVTVVP